MKKILKSITDTLCMCPKCKWTGTIWDASEVDPDDDGNIRCPKCLTNVEFGD